jgi:N-acetyl-anhydromuramyl-L-alanine amidase AmpD
MSSFPTIYPAAAQEKNGTLKTSGLFPSGYPQGITIHYTADRMLERSIESLVQHDLGYHFLIDRKGVVYQTASMKNTIWHAGKATWESLSPNRFHLAISLLSYGLLTKKNDRLFTWFNLEVDPIESAYRDGRYWDAATEKQEIALDLILKWLIEQGIEPSSVCGHNECCLPQGRKVDPGGVLFRSMKKIREDLIAYRRKNKGMA